MPPRRVRPQAQTLPRTTRHEEGFSLIELMVATVVMLIVMAAAVTGVFEAQRGMNTIVDRSTSINEAQPFLDAIGEQVRQADAIAEYGGAGPYSQLWLYRASPSSAWNYKCTVWLYDGTSTALEAYVSNSSVQLASPTRAQIAAAMTFQAQLPNVSPSTGSGPFQYFSAFPGLVGIDVMVAYPGGGSGGDVQAASPPSRVEVEADNVGISSGTGLAPLGSSNPSSSCY